MEDQETRPSRNGQVPNGQGNLVPTKETKTKSPQPAKISRGRKRTSKQVNIIEMPTELPEIKPTKEMENESQRPMETPPQRPLKNPPQIVLNNILELTKENWVESMWEDVRRTNKS